MLDSTFIKVLIPVGNQFWAEIISLIDQQNKLLLLTDIAYILLKIWAIEEIGISCIDDL